MCIRDSLKGALDLAKTLPDISKNIIAICGASDGASDDMIKQALAVEPDSLSSDIATFSAVGLRLRNNKDITPFEESLKNIANAEEYDILQFVKYIKSKNFNATENLLSDVAYTTEAELYALAYAAHGDKIPSDWKGKIKNMLFASEKLYIK